MAAVNDIREQIKVILQGVSGIGVVHDYDRLTTDAGKMVNLFKDTDGRINAVVFRREKMEKRKITIGSGPLERAHIWLIRCIMGLKDDQATGLVFDALLAAIEEEFEGNNNLNATCLTINPEWGPMSGCAGIQIDLCEDRLFGNVLCHYAELRLCSVERNER